jgi:hypothetical protein
MAGSATDYLENALLNHALGVTAYAFTSGTKYLALYSVAPTDNTLGTEVSGGAGPYARQLAAFSSSTLGSSQNTGIIDFTGMPAVTVVAIAVLDAATGGNMLFYSTLATTRSLSAGDTLRVPAGGLVVTLD